MRMMTGAILILAGSFLLGICETNKEDREMWIFIYSHVLTVTGIVFLLWGTVRDLSIYTRRRKRRMQE